MLTAQLFGTGPRWRPLGEAFAVLWQAEAWRQELIQLVELLAERCERRLHPLPWALPVPLRVHGRYSRAEIMAATGCAAALRLGRARCIRRPAQPPRGRALAPAQPGRLAVHHDLPLGPSLFHWESQSNTRAASSTGQRTIHHASRGSRVLLVVHEAGGFHAAGRSKEGGRSGGITEPFRCLGFARYEGHEGERPMAIRWRLERAIPAAWLPACCLA